MNATQRSPLPNEQAEYDAPLSVGLMLSRVAAELTGASDDLKLVQDTMDELADGALSSAGMVCLQSLDLVEQTIRALAEIVGSVAGLGLHAPDMRTDDILATCKLSSLVDRLAGIVRDEDTSFDLF
jgi:hypothetical protein